MSSVTPYVKGIYKKENIPCTVKFNTFHKHFRLFEIVPISIILYSHSI